MKSKGLGAILTKVAGGDSGSEPTTSGERIDKEMNLYLERPALDPDSDPLNWWQDEKKKLPVIAELVHKYYVHVEQVFHLNVFSAKLNSLLMIIETDCHHKMLTC